MAVPGNHVEDLRSLFGQFERGDFTALADLGDEIEVVTAPEMPDAGTYRGREAREWMLAWVGSFDSLKLTPFEFEGADDKVLVGFVQRGLPRGGSAAVEVRSWQVVTYRNDEAVRLELFLSRDPAVRAAGLAT